MSEQMGDTIAPSSLTPSASLEPPQTSAESTSPPYPAEPTPAQSSAIAYLSTLLNRPLRLTATDGRTFIGPLICVDKSSNVVLSPAEEFPPRVPSPGTPGSPADAEAWLARRRHDVLWPKSESFDGPGRGWGGRPLAMILVEGDKIRKVELMDEDVVQGQAADRYT